MARPAGQPPSPPFIFGPAASKGPPGLPLMGAARAAPFSLPRPTAAWCRKEAARSASPDRPPPLPSLSLEPAAGKEPPDPPHTGVAGPTTHRSRLCGSPLHSVARRPMSGRRACNVQGGPPPLLFLLRPDGRQEAAGLQQGPATAARPFSPPLSLALGAALLPSFSFFGPTAGEKPPGRSRGRRPRPAPSLPLSL